MSTQRWDETWHRLRQWTNGPASSERLAAQILSSEGYTSIDPSHPLGGRDGTCDAHLQKDGNTYIMAAYFPRGQNSFKAIKTKYSNDLTGARKRTPSGFVFVTNQELTLSQRQSLVKITARESLVIDIFHLERITAILDRPDMAKVRKQFLGIDFENDSQILINAGGEGGKAIGAGGGGGAVIDHLEIGSKQNPTPKVELNGQSGIAPGAGGGGGGAIGNGAVAGSGGSGGEVVDYLIDEMEMKNLLAQGFTHIDLVVGQGGKSDQDGGNSIALFKSHDGKVLKSLVAIGGKSGGTSNNPRIEQIPALHVSTLILAECAQLKHGLLNLLGAGWDNWTTDELPFTANWPLICSIDLSGSQSGITLNFEAIVSDPRGSSISTFPFSFTTVDAPVTRPSVVVPLSFVAAEAGIWSICINFEHTELARLSIDIRLKESRTPPEEM